MVNLSMYRRKAHIQISQSGALMLIHNFKSLTHYCLLNTNFECLLYPPTYSTFDMHFCISLVCLLPSHP